MPPKPAKGGGKSPPPKGGPAGPVSATESGTSGAPTKERLFLLEVLIDKIIFLKSPCFSDKGFRTCVKITFLNVDPIEICDDDSASDVPSGGPFIKNFNNGKSCLFSLMDADIDAARHKFRIHVSVSKSLPCGCLPTHVVMGEANIDMTKEFIQSYYKNTNQALKDSFRIMTPDGHTVAGNILMFLRISCFGKNIVTKFQGGQAPPSILGGGGTSGVDHSCKSPKEYQTSKDPCRCGAVHSGGGAHTCNAIGGGGGGPCPQTKDPYNSKPCEDPDDPCYCSGPKPLHKDEMKCRNTDKYCLHVPKGGLLSLPYVQDIGEDQMWCLRSTSQERYSPSVSSESDSLSSESISTTDTGVQATACVTKCIQIRSEDMLNMAISELNTRSKGTLTPQSSSMILSATSRRHQRRSNHVLHRTNSDGKERLLKARARELSPTYTLIKRNEPFYRNNEVKVYMTLYDAYSNRFRVTESSTQATASVNKCLQVSTGDIRSHNILPILSGTTTASEYLTSCTSQFTNIVGPRQMNRNSNCPEVYFFGYNNQPSSSKSGSNMKKKCTGPCARKTIVGNASVQANSDKSNTDTQTKGAAGNSAGTNTGGKSVSINESGSVCPRPGCSAAGNDDNKRCPRDKPCPAGKFPGQDMAATVSHICIGPRSPCPVHGLQPCGGPKCTVNKSEDKAHVTLTNVNNPRRGVFELVIRRLTGAPLAKNELMLEWTPPPAKPPCGAPCGPPCGNPCGPCKSCCKMIVCKPVCCRPKCGKPPCGKPPCCQPCPPSPCSKPCGMCCLPKPCRPCKPCSPCAIPCRSPPCCGPPCGGPPCGGNPCTSSPCLRLCPVGRCKRRRCRSQPKIRPHRKMMSPCLNRSHTCPVVKCRSLPGPCAQPCPPPKCCKSSCTSCCP